MVGKMPPPTAAVAAATGATTCAIVIEGWDRAKTIFSDRPRLRGCHWHRSRFSPPSFAQAVGLRREPPGSTQRRRAAAPLPDRQVQRWPSVACWATATAPAPSAFPARRYARSRQARRRWRQGLTPQRRPANDCAPKNAPQRFRAPDHTRSHRRGDILAAIPCRAVIAPKTAIRLCF
jgi:hypothetical protein